MSIAQPTSIPALSESVQSAHRYVNHLENVLGSVHYALTGGGWGVGDTAAVEPSGGLLHDALSLTQRLNGLISIAETIQSRVAPEQPEKQAMVAGGMNASPTRPPGY